MGATTITRQAIAAACMLAAAAMPGRAETLLERGSYLVNGIANCGNCHSPQEPDGSVIGDPLSGGPAIPTAAFTAYPPNITPDVVTGIGAWTTEQIVTALREGRTPDGKVLRPPMPVGLYRAMSDRDATAIATYLKSLPAASRQAPVSEYRAPTPSGYGPPVTNVPDPDPAEPVAYGGYLVRIGHCMQCHTPVNAKGQRDYGNRLGAGGLAMDGVFGPRITPNITPDRETGIGAWTDQDIRVALTTGATPAGGQLGSPMPWPYLAKSIPSDIDAIIAYLRTIPAIPNRVK